MKVLAGVVLLSSAHSALAQDAADGDAAAGANKAKICKTCHQFGEGAKNAIGPVLNGVVGRKAGTYPGYDYSEANKNSGITWDEATLKVYLKNPKAKVPGTKMSFVGFQKDSDINNVVAFLKTLGPDGKTK
ncbi:c-type cytochrome [Lichenifustis flavocetrariae]|uniref:c-type cytochrome n=1 Tax=Lichenifustis flavocetrariae TaxID=2949735 RepID=UPI003D0C73D0